MAKLLFRVTSYCKEKYKFELTQPKINVFDSSIEYQINAFNNWISENNVTYHGGKIFFYEVDSETGEIKQTAEHTVDNTKPQPRILNDDSCSDPVEAPQGDSEVV